MVIDNDNSYIDILQTKYFPNCTGKVVLEIGASIGYHSKLISENFPKYFEVIESNENCYELLKKNEKIDNIIIDNVFSVLRDYKKFDIVVCFGVLYHLPHSLHLLELIVNYNNPDIIMLDSYIENQIRSIPEPINEPGHRYVNKNWKTCGVNIILPFENIDLCLSNLGYKLKEQDFLNISYGPIYETSKNNSWLALWEKAT